MTVNWWVLGGKVGKNDEKYPVNCQITLILGFYLDIVELCILRVKNVNLGHFWAF